MTARKRKVGTWVSDQCLIIAQCVTYPFGWWLSRRIRLQVHVPTRFTVPRGTLVLANHRSLLDPFLVSYHLCRGNWYSSIPLRYPAKSDHMRHRVFGPIMACLGAYDIGATPMERAKRLLRTRDILDSKYTVLLFPEGKIVKKGRLVGEFQRGAHMLFSYDYPVVFAHLSGFTTASFFRSQKSPAQITYSPVIEGNAQTKIRYMEQFFGTGGLCTLT